MEHGCWVLGGEFEDSMFEDRPERLSRPLAPYGAKSCEPQWFYEETESSDGADVLTLKKFRGDLAYRRQEYEKALQEYSTISEKLSPTNFAMKRDVQEGQARCLAHLGRHVEALEIATNLENKATNTDHLTTVLYLQFAICSSLQNLEKTILCLQKLISLHPLNPWIWYKLAEAYLNLGPALSASNAYLNLGPAPSASSAYLNLGPAPSASNAYLILGPAPSASSASSWEHKRFTSNGKAIKSSCLLCLPETLPKSLVFSMEASSSNHQKAEKVADTHTCLSEARETVWIETQMKACSALIRTRLLLQLTQPQQTSFVLEKNLRTQQEIADEMKGFGFTEDALLLIEEVMGEDIVLEKIKDEAHSEVKCVGPAALTALVVASSKEFEDKWFRKIKECFCL